MRLFLDTNALIDHLAQREPFAQFMKTLCIAAYFGDVELWANAQSYTDALHYLQEYVSQKELREAALGTLEFMRPCGVRADDLRPALCSDWPDVEDFIIARCAANVGANYIITRDALGFGKSAVPAISAEEAVTLLKAKGMEYDEVLV